MKGTEKLLAVVVVVLVLALVPIGISSAITHGEPDGNDHPYVGLVLFYDEAGDYMWRCTGTLISADVVMTAGHCVSDPPPDSARVLFDADLSNLIYPYETCAGYTCYDGTPHKNPDYDDYWSDFPNTHDYGVVTLDQPVSGVTTYGSLPKIGALDELSKKKGKKYIVRTVGYGLQEVKPSYQADRIRYTSTSRIVNLGSANEGGFGLRTSNNPSPTHGTGGSCFGDSGGPIFYPEDSNIVVGIVSWGNSPNCKGVDWAYRTDIEETQEFVKSFLP
jgi:hypothetical protein